MCVTHLHHLTSDRPWRFRPSLQLWVSRPCFVRRLRRWPCLSRRLQRKDEAFDLRQQEIHRRSRARVADIYIVVSIITIEGICPTICPTVFLDIRHNQEHNQEQTYVFRVLVLVLLNTFQKQKSTETVSPIPYIGQKNIVFVYII